MSASASFAFNSHHLNLSDESNRCTTAARCLTWDSVYFLRKCAGLFALRRPGTISSPQRLASPFMPQLLSRKTGPDRLIDKPSARRCPSIGSSMYTAYKECSCQLDNPGRGITLGTDASPRFQHLLDLVLGDCWVLLDSIPSCFGSLQTQ